VDADIARMALPLRTEHDLDPLLERIGRARIVLLGEASHGTHEFYAWRAAITRRLIEEKRFGFVAVEGDWPDCYEVNCSVTGAPGAAEDPRTVLAAFDRWPTWMWANEDVAGFVRWLRERNVRRPRHERVGFFGLDVYSLWDSLRRTLAYLRAHEPAHVDAALSALRCLEPYAEDPQEYARATRWVPATCESAVIDVLRELRGVTGEHGHPDDARFDAEQNALVAEGAEAYYRAMVSGGPASWNIRDRHMAQTLDRLLAHHRATGRADKAIVWEHNTHVGDARFTDMADVGMVNVGQLAREAHGEHNVVIVGFGSHSGTVTAAPRWDAPAEAMRVPPAHPASTEELLRRSGAPGQSLFVHPRGEQPEWLARRRDHRAIGVVYRPHAEQWGNYVPTVLGRRYDALLWFERTTALQPLHAEPEPAAREDMADLGTDL
jgi:erythromycin esterase